MRIICAPDSFKGSISATEAARAMAEGVLRARPQADVDLCPVGDGGEGTLDSLIAARGGAVREVTVQDAAGNPTQGAFGLLDDGRFAWVESASAIGLPKIPEELRDAMAASSYGVGELMMAASDETPGSLVVGVGGSASSDGGCGMAQALGVRFLDANGSEIQAPMGGADLARINAIDVSMRRELNSEIIAACDVMSPLVGEHGAARVFGPQKGASPEDVRQLDDGLAHLAAIIHAEMGIDVRELPGAGAAGGLGAGLLAFAGATLESGTSRVLEAVRFAERVERADLCLTGEGKLDEQSMAGKICLGVAWAAAQAGVPAIALVGSTGPGAERCLEAGLTRYVEIGRGLPEEESMRNASALIANAAHEVIADL